MIILRDRTSPDTREPIRLQITAHGKPVTLCVNIVTRWVYDHGTYRELRYVKAWNPANPDKYKNFNLSVFEGLI